MTLNREYPELKTHRDAIDAIDAEIVRLIEARSVHVQQVGALKRAAGETGNFIRPDREALMIRKIAGRFAESPFPARSACAIWRQIIGGSTTMEAPLRLLLAGDVDPLPAREHFGAAIPCERLSVEDTLSALESDPHAIGIFPAAANSDWWAKMAATRVSVFARLPYIRHAKADRCLTDQDCYAAARIEPSASGEDRSLFLIVGGNVPPGARLLASDFDNLLLLIEIDGWHEDVAALDRLAASLPASAAVTFLGGYAVPFTL